MCGFCCPSAKKRIALEADDTHRWSSEATSLRRENQALTESLSKARVEVTELRDKMRDISSDAARRAQQLEAESIALSREMQVCWWHLNGMYETAMLTCCLYVHGMLVKGMQGSGFGPWL